MSSTTGGRRSDGGATLASARHEKGVWPSGTVSVAGGDDGGALGGGDGGGSGGGGASGGGASGGDGGGPVLTPPPHTQHASAGSASVHVHTPQSVGAASKWAHDSAGTCQPPTPPSKKPAVVAVLFAIAAFAGALYLSSFDAPPELPAPREKFLGIF